MPKNSRRTKCFSRNFYQSDFLRYLDCHICRTNSSRSIWFICLFLCPINSRTMDVVFLFWCHCSSLESSKSRAFHREYSTEFVCFQLVNLIPVTRHMPRWGEGEINTHALPMDIGSEGQARTGTSLTKGQILWLRGITRLQTQVGFCSRYFSLVLVFLQSLINFTNFLFCFFFINYSHSLFFFSLSLTNLTGPSCKNFPRTCCQIAVFPMVKPMIISSEKERKKERKKKVPAFMR